jgi:hypothetical protein
MGLQQVYSPPSPNLRDESFQIAWAYLQGSGQIREGQEYAARLFIRDTLLSAAYEGVRHKLVMANRAITAYERAFPGE